MSLIWFYIIPMLILLGTLKTLSRIHKPSPDNEDWKATKRYWVYAAIIPVANICFLTFVCVMAIIRVINYISDNLF